MSPETTGRLAGAILLETLVALVLLAVGLLGLAAATATVARQTEIANARQRLAAHARNEMERRMARARVLIPGPADSDDDGTRLEWSVVESDRSQLRLVASLRWRSVLVSDTLILLSVQ